MGLEAGRGVVKENTAMRVYLYTYMSKTNGKFYVSQET